MNKPLSFSSPKKYSPAHKCDYWAIIVKNKYLFIGIACALIAAGVSVFFLFQGQGGPASGPQLSGQGKVLTISEGQSSKFDLDSVMHTVTVLKVNPSRVLFEIKSNPIQIEVGLGEVKSADVNGDGMGDIEISVSKISGKKTTFTVRKIIAVPKGSAPSPSNMPSLPTKSAAVMSTVSRSSDASNGYRGGGGGGGSGGGGGGGNLPPPLPDICIDPDWNAGDAKFNVPSICTGKDGVLKKDTCLEEGGKHYLVESKCGADKICEAEKIECSKECKQDADGVGYCVPACKDSDESANYPFGKDNFFTPGSVSFEEETKKDRCEEGNKLIETYCEKEGEGDEAEYVISESSLVACTSKMVGSNCVNDANGAGYCTCPKGSEIKFSVEADVSSPAYEYNLCSGDKVGDEVQLKCVDSDGFEEKPENTPGRVDILVPLEGGDKPLGTIFDTCEEGKLKEAICDDQGYAVYASPVLCGEGRTCKPIGEFGVAYCGCDSFDSYELFNGGVNKVDGCTGEKTTINPATFELCFKNVDVINVMLGGAMGVWGRDFCQGDNEFVEWYCDGKIPRQKDPLDCGTGFECIVNEVTGAAECVQIGQPQMPCMTPEDCNVGELCVAGECVAGSAKPDLIISDVRVNRMAGQTPAAYKLEIDVKNVGAGAAGMSRLLVNVQPSQPQSFIDSNGGVGFSCFSGAGSPIPSNNLVPGDTLGAGETERFEDYFSPVEAGQIGIAVTVDADNEVDESDETNNAYTASSTVEALIGIEKCPEKCINNVCVPGAVVCSDSDVGDLGNVNGMCRDSGGQKEDSCVITVDGGGNVGGLAVLRTESWLSKLLGFFAKLTGLTVEDPEIQTVTVLGVTYELTLESPSLLLEYSCADAGICSPSIIPCQNGCQGGACNPESQVPETITIKGKMVNGATSVPVPGVEISELQPYDAVLVTTTRSDGQFEFNTRTDDDWFAVSKPFSFEPECYTNEAFGLNKNYEEGQTVYPLVLVASTRFYGVERQVAFKLAPGSVEIDVGDYRMTPAAELHIESDVPLSMFDVQYDPKQTPAIDFENFVGAGMDPPSTAQDLAHAIPLDHDVRVKIIGIGGLEYMSPVHRFALDAGCHVYLTFNNGEFTWGVGEIPPEQPCHIAPDSCNSDEEFGISECMDENNYHTCSRDENQCFEWSTSIPCDYGCQSRQCKAPPQICAPVTTQCSEDPAHLDYLEQCNADGSAWILADTPCQYGCDSVAGTCKNNPCEDVVCPDTCNGNIRTYNGQCVNGGCKYSTGQVCEYGCEAGTCKDAPPDCSQGEKKCSGFELLSCKADGSGWNVAQDCRANGKICMDLESGSACVCDNKCVEGEKKCIDSYGNDGVFDSSGTCIINEFGCAEWSGFLDECPSGCDVATGRCLTEPSVCSETDIRDESIKGSCSVDGTAYEDTCVMKYVQDGASGSATQRIRNWWFKITGRVVDETQIINVNGQDYIPIFRSDNPNSELLEYTCAIEECSPQIVACVYGCYDGACKSEPVVPPEVSCAGVLCLDYCEEDDFTLMSEGTCVNGVCQYLSATGCDGGCENDACNLITECTDSDNGRIYEIYGETSGQRVDDATVLEIQSDYCYDEDADGIDESLYEYYCSANQVLEELIECQNGCQNGACLTQPEQQCIPALTRCSSDPAHLNYVEQCNAEGSAWEPTTNCGAEATCVYEWWEAICRPNWACSNTALNGCTDTDCGSYYTEGNVNGWSDGCLDNGNQLIEASCYPPASGDPSVVKYGIVPGVRYSITYECPYGCFNGACRPGKYCTNNLGGPVISGANQGMPVWYGVSYSCPASAPWCVPWFGAKCCQEVYPYEGEPKYVNCVDPLGAQSQTGRTIQALAIQTVTQNIFSQAISKILFLFQLF